MPPTQVRDERQQLRIAAAAASVAPRVIAGTYVVPFGIPHRLWQLLTQLNILTVENLAYLVQGEVDRHVWSTEPHRWYVKTIEVARGEAEDELIVDVLLWLAGAVSKDPAGDLALLIAPARVVGLVLSLDGTSLAIGRDPREMQIVMGLFADGTFCEATHWPDGTGSFRTQSIAPGVAEALAGVLDRGGRLGLERPEA